MGVDSISGETRQGWRTGRGVGKDAGFPGKVAPADPRRVLPAYVAEPALANKCGQVVLAVTGLLRRGLESELGLGIPLERLGQLVGARAERLRRRRSEAGELFSAGAPSRRQLGWGHTSAATARRR